MTRPFYRLNFVLLAMALGCSTLGAAHAADEAVDPHAHHKHMMEPAADGVKTKTVAYKNPAVKLMRSDGKTVDLASELNDGRPVILNFIFTTCTAICPVMSHTFAEVQKKLGGESKKVHMVSISIDPEQDTPARLQEYATRYQSGPQWNFYTGSAVASIAAQKAFDAFRGDKMNHEPLTLMRKAPGQAWLRIEGLASPDDLMKQYQGLLASK